MSRYQPAKYGPLRRYLAAQSNDRVRLTFAEIETIIGAPLPAGARDSGRWVSGGGRSVQAQAWQAAGWRRTSVDWWRGVVVLERWEAQS